MNNYKNFFFLWLGLCCLCSHSFAQTPFLVTEKTPIEFSDKQALVFVDADTIAQQIKQGFENWQASHQRRDDVTVLVFKL